MGKRLVMMMIFVGRGLVFLDGNSVLFPCTNPAGREIFVLARTYLAVKQKCLAYSHVVGSVSQLPSSIGHPPHSSASPVELRLRVGPRALSGKKKEVR